MNDNVVPIRPPSPPLPARRPATLNEQLLDAAILARMSSIAAEMRKKEGAP